jgi:hypothetical protein
VRAEIWASDRRPSRAIENGGLNRKRDHSADESVRKSVWHEHLMKKINRDLEFGSCTWVDQIQIGKIEKISAWIDG